MIRSINLGAWLVLEERWMTPSVYEGTTAEDEYTLCQELGSKKVSVLQRHRERFITKADFEWIAAHGFELVRIPVGYWLFEDQDGYIATKAYLDKAMKWADETGLKILIDLHAAPGSQNGEIHSGRAGKCEWHTSQENVTTTIEVLRRIAHEYGSHQALWGIELLNEPSRDIPLTFLLDFYNRAYDEIRQEAGPGTHILINDGYRPMAEFEDFMDDPNRVNVLLDTHMYQTFGHHDQSLTFNEHIEKALQWRQMLQKFDPSKLFIGEWSIALHQTYNGMTELQRRYAQGVYRSVQLYAFSECAGQSYWTYKTESPGEWNYRSQFDNC